jgi:purine-nucleoside phosphorylase
MGMPSIGIYSYELYNFFGVKNILRVGSAGGMQPYVHVRDIILGMGASTDSRYAEQYNLPGTFAPIADYGLLSIAKRISEERGYAHHVGNLISSDVFYGDDLTASERWRKMGILAVDEDKKEIISEIAENSQVPVLTRKSDAIALKKIARKCFEKDVLASDLYDLITDKKTNENYTLFV